MKDMGPTVPEVALEYFLSCLPPVDEEIFAKVYDDLKAKNVVTEEGWYAMKYDELEKQRAEQGTRKQRKRRKQNEKRRKKKKEQNKGQVSQQQTPDGPGPASQQVDEPSQTSAGQPTATIHEDDFFNPVVHCFNAVLDEANQVLMKDDHWKEVLFKFRSNPRSSSRSEDPHGSYKSDVYALLKESRATKGPNAEDHESDVILPGEYRKDDNWVNQKENIRKLVGAVNHIMAYDPTRRFMFGITIEHRSTRFWFFSRSHVFVTNKVDLQKEAKQVISVILALGSATLHELGFDLTIEHVFSDEKNDTEEFLLKDYYIPEDGRTEKEVLDDIYDKVNKANPVPDLVREEFHRYFVQTEDCERVQVRSMKDRTKFVDVNTRNFLRHPFLDNPSQYSLIPNPSYMEQIATPISGSSLAMRTPGSYTLGTATNHDQLYRIVREHYGRKVHCRLLMKDAGSTLHDVPNLLTLLKCLKEVVKALQYMYSAGYVHRDISTGNILYRYHVNGQISVRLSDLEYAKDISQPREANQDARTGTPHFMAVEVETRGYLFMDVPPEVATLYPSQVLVQASQGQDDLDSQEVVGEEFVFNYLHDLESVWWILVYTLFSKLPEGMVLEGDCLKKHHAIRRQIFPHPNRSDERQLFLLHSFKRRSYLKTLPDAFGSIGLLASLLGNYLQAQYRLIENKPEFPSGSCSADLHRTIFTDFLDETVYEKVAFGGELCRVPSMPPVEGPPPATSGRSIGTEEFEEISTSYYLGSSSFFCD